jgi:hypothetical protein
MRDIGKGNNIKMDHNKIVYEKGGRWKLAQDRVQWHALVLEVFDLCIL